MKTDAVEKHLQRIKYLIPEDEDAYSYLKGILLAALTSPVPQKLGIVPASIGDELRKRLASGLITLENLQRPERILQRPEGIVDLYNLEWLLRPALPLTDGCFERLSSGPWKDLEGGILALQSNSVCRIDLTFVGHLGTGFFIGETSSEYVIATNAHVIEGALASYWLKYGELSLMCSFGEEQIANNPIFRNLLPKYAVHENLDIGLLYLAKSNIDHVVHGLSIDRTVDEKKSNFRVGVIGHPSFNSNKDPFPSIYGFGEAFGIKRISLGFIRAVIEKNWRSSISPVVLHDACTLSGSSGSCIFDLDNKKVIAIHFGGWPKANSQTVKTKEGLVLAELFEANGAIPLWKIINGRFFHGIELY